MEILVSSTIRISPTMQIAKELHYLAEGSRRRYDPVHHDGRDRYKGEKTHAPSHGHGELWKLVGPVRWRYVGVEGEPKRHLEARTQHCNVMT